VVVEEVAVLVVLVRRHCHAVRAAVRRAVDDEISSAIKEETFFYDGLLTTVQDEGILFSLRWLAESPGVEHPGLFSHVGNQRTCEVAGDAAQNARSVL